MNDTVRFKSITDGCGDETELPLQTLELYSSGVSAYSVFTIQSFQFHNSDTDICLHCEVSIFINELKGLYTELHW